MLETCENCERSIGRLETAHLHKGHIVCADCIRRLSPSSCARGADPLPSDDPNTKHRILFQKSGIVVTASWIKGAGNANVLIERVLSVKILRGSFSFGVKVEVTDSARNGHVYRFSDKEVAAEFIDAIQKAKGSIVVE